MLKNKTTSSLLHLSFLTKNSKMFWWFPQTLGIISQYGLPSASHMSQCYQELQQVPETLEKLKDGSLPYNLKIKI